MARDVGAGRAERVVSGGVTRGPLARSRPRGTTVVGAGSNTAVTGGKQ